MEERHPIPIVRIPAGGRDTVMAIPTTMHAAAPITRMIDPAPAKNVSRKGSNASVTKIPSTPPNNPFIRGAAKTRTIGIGCLMMALGLLLLLLTVWFTGKILPAILRKFTGFCSNLLNGRKAEKV